MVTTTAARSDLDLCLLGPLRVTVDGREVPLGGPRQMAVLARLMVTPGQVVSMDQLIDSVWDGGEPNQPHVTVRSYVSNLRRAIEPNRRRRATDSCLASSPPGYRLTVDPGAVDWIRFQRLIDEGRTRAEAGDSGAAITLLRRALSLWRGEPCSGLPTSEVFEAHRIRLTALRQTAVELVYQSMLDRGEHQAVAGEIEAAVVADPLRERLTELAMLAFYRSGRQSEALALGRRLRDRLRDELGIDPSRSIEEMEFRILNHDPVLDREGTGPASMAGGSADGGGSGRPGSAAGPDGVATERPVPVGRADARRHLAAIERALAAGHLGAAAVVGEQGSGKTTLARELADRVETAGGRTVWAHNVSDGSAPLWPWAQIALELFERDGRPVEELAAGLDALSGLGRSVAAALDLSSPDPSTPTAEVILAVAGLVGRCARSTPLLIVLEDLHWADRATVTVLEYLVSTLVDSPVGFVATWREPEAGDGPLASGLRSLGRLPALRRIDLGPMDATEVGDLAVTLDRSLTSQEAIALQRRTAGNPLFVTELLDAPSADSSGTGRPGPSLRAVVVDLVDGVHPLALTVLRAAALFRGPFTAEDLTPLHPSGPDAVERVIVAALRAQILTEVELSLGTYRFRHPIVQEVLAADIEPSGLRTSHRIIGTHLVEIDEAEASYHLAWSPDPADRALAARIALDVFHGGSRTVGLPELDGRIRNGLTAAEALRRTGQGADCDDLVTDALGFLSWRARVEDRPVDWSDNAWRNLRAAIDELESGADPARDTWDPPTSTTPLRGVGRERPRHRPIDRLERAVLNLIGLPVMPVGPGDPRDFLACQEPIVQELESAIERLPADSAALIAARVHLIACRAPGQPRSSARNKVVREAHRFVAAARRRLDPPELAPALAVFVARFAQDLEPERVEALLDEHAVAAPGPAADLLWARHGYPALLLAGRLDAAAGRVEDAIESAEVGGDPLQRTEARFLMTRHLLWIGDHEGAERTIEEAASELAAVGLPEPSPLSRQRRILRSLRGQPGDDVPGSGVPELGRVPVGLLSGDRVSPAEAVFRLAHLGQRERAFEHLTRLATDDRTVGLDPAELALLGATSALVRHRTAAGFLLERLDALGDRFIVRHDGSAIYGPATVWAAVTALAAGKRTEARRLLELGLQAFDAAGGALPLDLLEPAAKALELPIDPQPNLKPAGAK